MKIRCGVNSCPVPIYYLIYRQEVGVHGLEIVRHQEVRVLEFDFIIVHDYFFDDAILQVWTQLLVEGDIVQRTNRILVEHGLVHIRVGHITNDKVSVEIVGQLLR